MGRPPDDAPADEVPRGPVAAIGLAGGVVGGLLGGGSGVLMVPALDRFTRLSRARVHGTSTVANTTVCGVGAGVYAMVGGNIDTGVAPGLIAGGIVGGLFGARLLARASETLLRVLLIAVLLLTSAKLYLDAAGLDPLASVTTLGASLRSDGWLTLLVTAVLGLLIGAWAGAMGLGGGLLAVPLLVLLFGVELHTAEGTSLLMFTPNSLVSGVVHLRQGTASWRAAVPLGLAAIPGTVVGALIGLALDAVVLGLVFGTFALAMAVREIRQLVLARRAVTPPDGDPTP